MPWTRTWPSRWVSEETLVLRTQLAEIRREIEKLQRQEADTHSRLLECGEDPEGPT